MTTKGFLIFGLSTDSKMGQSAEGRFSPDFPHFFPDFTKKMRAAKTAGALTGDQNYDGALRTNVQKGWSAVGKRGSGR